MNLYNQKMANAINATRYDPGDPDELCPERKADLGNPGRWCRNLYVGRCALLDHSGERALKRLEDVIPDGVGCKTRIKLLNSYDQCLANGTQSNFFAAMESIISETQANETPHSAEAMAAAYEEWQYGERKRQGEPVTFRAGRCWYDGAVFAADIQPGPFPGPEFYMRDEKLVDPNWLRSWLSSDDYKRWQEHDPSLVGYYGQSLCAVRHWDLLGYYVWRWNVYGSETYRQLIRRNPAWVKGLFHHIYNVW